MSLEPLPHRMRPRKLEEIIGQEHILSPGKFLYEIIKFKNLVPSFILWGPPGIGKTTLAKFFANEMESTFYELNATTSSTAEIKKIGEDSKLAIKQGKNKSIVFIDEIHRFRKDQQDVLLPLVERGHIAFIGATTENPYVTVNSALLSRAPSIELKPLTQIHIRQLILKAIEDNQYGLGYLNVEIDELAVQYLTRISDGDARFVLNLLEFAANIVPESNGIRHITLETMGNLGQQKMAVYNLDASEHYHIASAFIKSIRGSDPQAAVYYLARMLHFGEDPRFVARRMVIAASEDIGNANPMALSVATNALLAVEKVGMPEARIILSQAATYLATSPKSNAAYVAINKALDELREGPMPPIPYHLRDHSYNPDKHDFREMPCHALVNREYQYPHDYEGSWCWQQYLPDGIEDKVYYNPTENGNEKNIKQRMIEWGYKKKRD